MTRGYRKIDLDFDFYDVRLIFVIWDKDSVYEFIVDVKSMLCFPASLPLSMCVSYNRTAHVHLKLHEVVRILQSLQGLFFWPMGSESIQCYKMTY
jgi:hypothetical protein